ncbi:MAG: hypothetical protein IJS69_04910 [Selenomonadaceae bacterium]|nr:hypothetical protein [Selenomonadaceae bacterium]
MADTKNSVTMTFGYTNTDFTRKYKFDGLSASDISGAKAKIKAINASIAGGTDGGLSDFFRSDDYDDSDPNAIVGKFSGIVAAQVDSTTETVINLNE